MMPLCILSEAFVPSAVVYTRIYLHDEAHAQWQGAACNPCFSTSTSKIVKPSLCTIYCISQQFERWVSIIMADCCFVCRQHHVNKQQVLQRAIQRMRRSELSRCFYLWRDRFGEVDDYARKRRKVWASSHYHIMFKCVTTCHIQCFHEFPLDMGGGWWSGGGPHAKGANMKHMEQLEDASRSCQVLLLGLTLHCTCTACCQCLMGQTACSAKTTLLSVLDRPW